MQTDFHHYPGVVLAELTACEVALRTEQDALDLFGSFYPEQVDGVIVYEENLPPEFFQLQTRLAGDILQKFVNYGVRIAIVGDFTKYASKALADFIRESNRGRRIFFVATQAEALDRLVQAAS